MPIAPVPTRRGLPLRQRLLLSTLLSAIPLIVLGVVLLVSWYMTRQAQILESNRQQAQLAAVYLNGWVQGHITTLLTLVGSNEVQRGTVADIQGLVERQQRIQQEWDNLMVTNAAGQVIAGVARPFVYVGDRPYFQQVREQRRPVVTDMIISRAKEIKEVLIAVPVQQNGQFTGAVLATIRLETLQQVIGEVPVSGDTVVGLWDSRRVLFARSNTPVDQLGVEYSGDEIDFVLGSKAGSRVGTSPVTKQRAFIGYTPVPDTPWTVVVATEYQSAMAPLYSSMAIFILLSLAVLIFSLIWSFYSANQLAAQVNVLVDGARAIGAGQLDTRVTLRTGGELEELANSLNKMAADLAVIDRLKSDFLNMISHELKTPLTTILGTLEVLSTGVITPDHPRYQEILDGAERQAHKLQDMIENLLSVARKEAGTLSVTPKPTPLGQIVTISIDQYLPLAKARGLAVKVDVPMDLMVMADAPRVTLALNNLLDNAMKFTEAGTIALNARAEENEVVITVTDTGIGLAPEVYDRLFQRFVQNEPLMTRRVGGAGLGLAVVAAIVEAHHGRLIVESPGPHQGSTFGFTLPLANP